MKLECANGALTMVDYMWLKWPLRAGVSEVPNSVFYKESNRSWNKFDEIVVSVDLISISACDNGLGCFGYPLSFSSFPLSSFHSHSLLDHSHHHHHHHFSFYPFCLQSITLLYEKLAAELRFTGITLNHTISLLLYQIHSSYIVIIIKYYENYVYLNTIGSIKLQISIIFLSLSSSGFTFLTTVVGWIYFVFPFLFPFVSWL